MTTPTPRAPSRPGVHVRTLLWGGPLVFLVHDAEEIATIERWTRAHLALFPPALRARLPVTTREFAWSVALVFLAYVALSAADALRLRRGDAPRWSVLAVATLVANALTHLLQALAVRGYTPGVVTAAAVVLPFGAWVYRLGRREGWLDARRAGFLVVAGAVLQVALAPIALLGGRLLAG